MRNKINYLGLFLLGVTLLSCDNELADVGGSVIGNDKMDKKQLSFDVKLTQKDIEKVETDDVNFPVSEYLLGYYNPKKYKKINASIVAKFAYPGNLNTNIENSTYTLDKVILKIPYADVKTADKVLGNSSEKTSLKVLLNETYLNKLNPKDPSKNKVYFSDETFTEGDNLLENDTFEFSPQEKDTVYYFERTKVFNGEHKFKDSIKVANKLFLAIPLNKQKLKELFWDKLNGSEFQSKESFDDYLKGIIIKSVGNKGSLLSLNTSKNPISIDFYYTITRTEKGKFKDTLNERFSVYLGTPKINVLTSESAEESTANCVKIQGTVGSEAEVNLLTKEQLEELKKQKILINDAVLTFHVNQDVDTNSEELPQRLLLYKSGETKEHIFKSAFDFGVYGGVLESKDNKPQVYKLRILEYIKDLVRGKKENTPLRLKVFNSATDLLIYNKSLDNTFRFYNSNPRGVTLYDGNTANGVKKAELKISYSKEK